MMMGLHDEELPKSSLADDVVELAWISAPERLMLTLV